MSVGTPDNTRGFVNAQKPLATVPANTITQVVAIPALAETLVLVCNGPLQGYIPTVTGNTTGMEYTGSRAAATTALFSGSTWFFDVASPVDSAVTVTWNIAPPFTWYLYADAGVHINADVSKRVNEQGVQYVIPTPPGPFASDHPPIELSIAYGVVAASAVAIAAPGAGQRLRLFSANLMVTGAGANFCVLGDTAGGKAYAFCGNGNTIDKQWYPAGFATVVNTQVEVFFDPAAAGTIGYSIYYTQETV